MIDIYTMNPDSGNRLGLLTHKCLFREVDSENIEKGNRFAVVLTSMLSKHYFISDDDMYTETIKYGMDLFKKNPEVNEKILTSDIYEEFKKRPQINGKHLKTCVLEMFLCVYRDFPMEGISNLDLFYNINSPIKAINDLLFSYVEAEYIINAKGFTLRKMEYPVTYYRLNPKKEKDVEQELFKKGVNLFDSELKKLFSTSDWAQIISEGETDFVEFKSSMMYCYRTKQLKKELVLEVVQSLAAFLNSKGGILFIGVDDSGSLLGLINDIRLLGKKKNKDEFLLRLGQYIDQYLGKPVNQFLSTEFREAGGLDCCLIKCHPSDKPVIVKYNGKEDFLIRSGPANKLLSTREAIEYINTHWSKS